MRIIYGVHTQGQGGLARASLLVPAMQARGHDVRVISSGTFPPDCYRFSWHQHIPGMEYVVSHGRADSFGTFQKWLFDSPQILSSLRRVSQVVDEFSPDLIISDFEPITANPLLRADCEVVAASRPVTLIDPQIEIPEGMELQRKLARTVIRLFTAGADRKLGYHFSSATFRCLPPLVHPDVRALRPTEGEHLLVYNVFHTDGSPHDLIRWAAQRKQYVKAYGFPRFRTGKYGYVTFHRPDRSGFLRDLASCRAVVCTAGVVLPVEAHVLGKPCSVVAIPNQWEQQVNAWHLSECGLASHLATWDYDRAMELARDYQPRSVSMWLQSPVDSVIGSLLGQASELPAQAETWHRQAA